MLKVIVCYSETLSNYYMTDTLLALGIQVKKSDMASASTELSLAEEMEHVVWRGQGWEYVDRNLTEAQGQGRLPREGNVISKLGSEGHETG